jgi:hypothetical protein
MTAARPARSGLAPIAVACALGLPDQPARSVTNGPGSDQCGPRIIERAMRDARVKVDDVPGVSAAPFAQVARPDMAFRRASHV